MNLKLRPAIAITTVVGYILGASVAAANEIGDSYQSISSPAEMAKIQKNFQHELNKLGFAGQVRSCRNAISIWFDAPSIGAICELGVRGKAVDVLICQNNMLGGITIASSFVFSDAWVAKFTQQNCTGG